MSDVANDDPRRCPAAGVGAFHDFTDVDVRGKDVPLERCQYCCKPIHDVLKALSDYMDRRKS